MKDKELSDLVERVERAVKRVELFDEMMRAFVEHPFFASSALAGIYYRETCKHCGGHLDRPR